MALNKNVASQKVLIFAWDTVARSPKTGDAGNITAYISKDGGAAVQSDDDNPTELDATDLPGIYAFDLLQAETNCDLFALKAGSSTADVEVDPVIVYTIVRDDYKADVTALALEATAQLIKTETDKIQPDIIASPDDYKANVAALALEATAQLIKTEADKIQPDIIASPGDYKADVSGLAPASEYDTEMARITADVATEAKQDVIDTVVDGIKAKTDTISWADITFLKDIEGGRWRIVSNQMIFYKSDNSTEVARFNLLDSAGSASMENVFERQRV